MNKVRFHDNQLKEKKLSQRIKENAIVQRVVMVWVGCVCDSKRQKKKYTFFCTYFMKRLYADGRRCFFSGAAKGKREEKKQEQI